ncbi:hypothetical protein [Sphingomonas morindae]|uniref:Lectin-like protein BA14k n=1 Tax=Sphingomonas morindae TaxID=1541170 RepID=A0ABY4XAT6_9SPHN|nr:hypothetical protein [Sphingomonas morindae]USI74086.1 hypothetical protein LHA26_06390 [Sphingomonas morindae]
MMGRIKAAMLGIAGAATLLAAASPAEARVSDGVAVAAGLLGLGVGVAIASHAHDTYADADDDAPPPVYYAPAPVYYAPPPPPSYAYEYVEHCRVVNHWDGWAGRYLATRRCW